MTLEELNRLLVYAWKAVDDAAKTVASSDLPERKESIRHLGEALEHIFEVQRTVHALRPDLRPAYLNDKPPYPPSEARRYGDVFLCAEELIAKGDSAAAADSWREYLAEDPHEFFRALAEQQMAHLLRDDAGA